MSLNDYYAKFRSGKGYAIALLVIIAGWIIADVIWHFDPGLSYFNVFLSMEASLSFPLLMIHQDQIRKEQEAMQQKQLKYMMDTMEAVLALLQEQESSQAQLARRSMAGWAGTDAGHMDSMALAVGGSPDVGLDAKENG